MTMFHRKALVDTLQSPSLDVCSHCNDTPLEGTHLQHDLYVTTSMTYPWLNEAGGARAKSPRAKSWGDGHGPRSRNTSLNAPIKKCKHPVQYSSCWVFTLDSNFSSALTKYKWKKNYNKLIQEQSLDLIFMYLSEIHKYIHLQHNSC